MKRELAGTTEPGGGHLARLHPEDVELLAERVALRLRQLDSPPALSERLVKAREIAVEFGLTPSWVRRNAARLGARRLGDGPRPRLRFDPDEVARTLASRSAGERSEGRDPPVPSGARGR